MILYAINNANMRKNRIRVHDINLITGNCGVSSYAALVPCVIPLHSATE